MIKAEVSPKNERVDVRHLTKYARTKSRRVVMLGNVSLDKKAVGSLTGEYEDEVTWEGIELPVAIKSRFRTARYDEGFYDVTVMDAIKSKAERTGKQPDYSEAKVTRAQALVAIGSVFYYLP